ncbi:MAG: phosphoribosylformylglycinamidine synthase [Eubacteriales bacterium]
MVFRVFVEKKPPLAYEAQALARDLGSFLGITGLQSVRVVNRYDVENITPELFAYARTAVFSEVQLDLTYDTLPTAGSHAFAVEYLPGQFDQRADSAAQCIQLISQGERPTVRTAKVYLLQGKLSGEELLRIKKYLINPVECREASMKLPATLTLSQPPPAMVETLHGFRELDEEGLTAFLQAHGLAMDRDDLLCCQTYFRAEWRDPTITEIRMLDTYWSDHCRHTTFHTIIDRVVCPHPLLQRAYDEYLETRRSVGRSKPVTLMDIATIAARHLRASGQLEKLDESEEINACTVKIEVQTKEGREPWLLLFKNETHNHPTEIEPFGGAATCIGGAIRDPLSGRAYVYAAMRISGAADPTRPLDTTLPGKLPQRKLVSTAAAGNSSYGNQIGLATCQVEEIYHDGYLAKHMELGAVIAATPAANVRRETPAPGDKVILLGGRTGRDGCGGATGSSKSHTLDSLEQCGAEVQKGNAPEERKLQRLFRNPEAARLIKRCNDFGAGGVSVAIGELADGLSIDLDAVPKKYEGLDGTELAISESQERMAVVVAPDAVERFCRLAEEENLEATVVATVEAEPRLRMTWNGCTIVDISRAFLDTNGAEKHITVEPEPPAPYEKPLAGNFTQQYFALAGDLNVCSKRGLSERFDSTIGAGTILLPFGGTHQLTPAQAMVNKISTERGDTDTCSYMSFGYNPFISEKSPYHGAYLAAVESVSKLIAAGASFEEVYLSLQEYFEKPLQDPRRWGKPFAALLGAYKAQCELGVAAIGGKDSMSGSFEHLDVPPTLVSFAVTTGEINEVVSGEFKAPGHKVVLLSPEYDEDGLPRTASLLSLFHRVTALMRAGKVYAAWTPTYGGVAEGVLKMALGNYLGFAFSDRLTLSDLFGYRYGAFVLEVSKDVTDGVLLGTTQAAPEFVWREEKISLHMLRVVYEGRLESVYSCNIRQAQNQIKAFTYRAAHHPAPAVRTACPRALIPVFPGTNCEYDTARALADAGADPQILVVNNLSAAAISRSIEQFAGALKDAQIVVIPGGFSGGDEPDGSGKFITAFFRNAEIRAQVEQFLSRRDGLMAGICNGFQALIKLGLVPYGRILDADETSPTLTYNTIGRHQSRIVRTRIASNLSPWLAHTRPGEIYHVPISHGEGRFLADESLICRLAASGQIATQYVNLQGEVTAEVDSNPANAMYAIEGITSPDGRVFGKMGHSERVGRGLYSNVKGNYHLGMFEAAVKYFK